MLTAGLNRANGGNGIDHSSGTLVHSARQALLFQGECWRVRNSGSDLIVKRAEEAPHGHMRR